MRDIIIVGSGRHGRIVAEAIMLGGQMRVAAFADDDPAKEGTLIDGFSVIRNWRERTAESLVVAIGNNEIRRRIFDEALRAGRDLATIISPAGHVSRGARVGRGTVVLGGAVIQAGSTVGNNVLVNAAAVIDHDAEIGDHAHVGLNCTVASFGRVAVGEWLMHGTTRLKAAPPV
jgi:sugar O-acyltransferase (sialic acid O-acetyltransferase NeuD family)